MSKHLVEDMQRLERQLLRVAAQVEEAVRRSMTALFERDRDAARQVIAGDAEIDQREVEVEEECLKILALHQPVAQDLRFLASCLKINNDLERIGDLACNIAERAMHIATRSTPIPDLLRKSLDLTMAMVRRSIDAFVRGDSKLARDVCADDQAVDDLHREIIGTCLEEMRRDTTAIDSAMELVSVSRCLERVADHATNIAEDVIYMVEGAIVRHGGAPDEAASG